MTRNCSSCKRTRRSSIESLNIQADYGRMWAVHKPYLESNCCPANFQVFSLTEYVWRFECTKDAIKEGHTKAESYKETSHSWRKSRRFQACQSKGKHSSETHQLTAELRSIFYEEQEEEWSWSEGMALVTASFFSLCHSTCSEWFVVAFWILCFSSHFTSLPKIIFEHFSVQATW